jgi:hypothetical protein
MSGGTPQKIRKVAGLDALALAPTPQARLPAALSCGLRRPATIAACTIVSTETGFDCNARLNWRRDSLRNSQLGSGGLYERMKLHFGLIAARAFREAATLPRTHARGIAGIFALHRSVQIFDNLLSQNTFKLLSAPPTRVRLWEKSVASARSIASECATS